jgi:hypothetical protein
MQRPSLGEGEPAATFVGRFGPRSRVATGDQIEAAVDTRSLHFFDPDTGLRIRDRTPTEGARP